MTCRRLGQQCHDAAEIDATTVSHGTSNTHRTWQMRSPLEHAGASSSCARGSAGKLTEDERNLDLWEIQEVLGNVDGHFVQESWGDVVALLNVVQRLLGLYLNREDH